jgi:uncharacterized protein (TIGR02466 family)
MMQYKPTRAITNTMLLFSTPVFAYDEYSDPNYIHDTSKEQQNMIENRGGNFSSAETNILELSSYSVIKDRILSGLHEYTNDVLHVEKRHEFYITQSWLNVNPPGSSHHRHNHSNSLISGVYYIDTSPKDSIMFISQNNQTVTNNPTIQINVSEFTIANSNSWQLPVKNNDIIFFPSTTLHEVSSNDGDRNRISLAFNCFVKGNFGSSQNLNELNL